VTESISRVDFNANVQFTLNYRGLVEHLADMQARPEFVRDLGPIEHSHLAAILESITEQTFLDALADSGTLCAVVTNLLRDPGADREKRNALVGIAVIAALKDYLLPLLLKAVQAKWDTNFEADRTENPFPVVMS